MHRRQMSLGERRAAERPSRSARAIYTRDPTHAATSVFNVATTSPLCSRSVRSAFALSSSISVAIRSTSAWAREWQRERAHV